MLRSRALVLALLIFIAAVFLFEPARDLRGKSERANNSSPQPEQTLAPFKVTKPRAKLPNPSSQDFTLNELLNFSGLSNQNETTEDPNLSPDGQVLSQTIRARGLEGGAGGNPGSGSNTSGGGNSGSSSPELDALREIEDAYQPRGSSLIGGAHVRGAVVPTPQETVEVGPVATATPTGELERVSGQARGYTMLYLMHPKARATVDKQVEIMLRAQVDDLYLGVLTDGTFSRDFAYFSDVLRRLSRASRSITLVIYLTNGATMRNFDQTVIDAGFNTVNPIDFRSLIRSDAATRDKFIRLTRPVLPILQLNRKLNTRNRNFVSVMLEDNLDDDSYLAMRRLADNIIGDRASFLRNPCPGCYEGNTSASFGDALELHDPLTIESLGSRDGFSLDGHGYLLPNETSEGGPMSFDDTKDLIITAASRGIRYFGLWRYQRQGLAFGQPLLPVDERTFEVPTEAAALAEIELLRTGLLPKQ